MLYMYSVYRAFGAEPHRASLAYMYATAVATLRDKMLPCDIAPKCGAIHLYPLSNGWLRWSAWVGGGAAVPVAFRALTPSGLWAADSRGARG